jgi:hypothetical protein
MSILLVLVLVKGIHLQVHTAGVGGGEMDTPCMSKLKVEVVERDTPCTSIDGCCWCYPCNVMLKN